MSRPHWKNTRANYYTHLLIALLQILIEYMETSNVPYGDTLCRGVVQLHQYKHEYLHRGWFDTQSPRLFHNPSDRLGWVKTLFLFELGTVQLVHAYWGHMKQIDLY